MFHIPGGGGGGWEFWVCVRQCTVVSGGVLPCPLCPWLFFFLRVAVLPPEFTSV